MENITTVIRRATYSDLRSAILANLGRDDILIRLTEFAGDDSAVVFTLEVVELEGFVTDCAFCGRRWGAKSPHAKTCSNACRQALVRQRRKQVTR